MTLAALPNLAIIAVLASQEDTQQPGSMDTTALAIISRLMAHNYWTILFQIQQQLEKRLCVIIILCSRLSSNVGWYVMWVQATEIIPTSVRGTGTNVAGLIAAAVTFAAPYITVIVSKSIESTCMKFLEWSYLF